ncbi:YdcF family protein [Jannaschia sp. CCS1]|uniref:YdcF family protein n=1 Tax=Jannaschia sp. (strain CCS1) TaxID=290400 RepID=UPI0002D4BB51|nr:YdcF family protein [Jannaschia sp. CCS1]
MILAGIAAYALILSGLAVYIAAAPGEPPVPEAHDAIICLGAGLSPTQGPDHAGPASRARAVTCAGLYGAAVAPLVVVTGEGIADYPVSTAMARVLMDHGVPEHAIVNEPAAGSTIQNAAFSVPLLPTETTRVVLVTQRFHLPRAIATFRIFTPWEVTGYEAPLPGQDAVAVHERRTPTRWLLREVAAYGSNAVRVMVFVITGSVGIDRDTRIGWFN